MADLRSMKDRAAELAASGKLHEAAAAYRAVLAEDPGDAAALQKLADVLRRAGELPRAVEAYRALAERFGRDGLLVKAIAVCKTILDLDPAHAATQAALAALYARRAGPANARPATAPRPARPAPATPEAATPLARIVSAARTSLDEGALQDVVVELDGFEPEEGDLAESTATPPPTGESVRPERSEAAPAAERSRRAATAPPVASALPRVPIFSDLSQEAFLALAAGVELRRFERGAPVVSEGEDGQSLYVVASGELVVSRRDDRGERVVLARLREGDFFGEMALLSGAPRSATVAAAEPAEVLELGADRLLAVAARHPELARSLQRFYRQRLLANALALSPVFRPFGRADRRLIMERFRARAVRPGDVIVREGEPSDGLYVVLEGAVDVVKRARGHVVGLLAEGELFGEVSCLRKTPATATVVVRRGGTLLRLPRADFDGLVAAYPQLLELVSELSDERLERQEAILSGHARWTDEGLVLV